MKNEAIILCSFILRNLKGTTKLWISTLDYMFLKAKIDLVSLYLQQLSLPGIQWTLSKWLSIKIKSVMFFKYYWSIIETCFVPVIVTPQENSSFVTFLTSWNLMEYINLYWHMLGNFSIADIVVKWGLKEV